MKYSIIVALGTPPRASRRGVIRLSGEGCHNLLMSFADVEEDHGRYKKARLKEPFKNLPVDLYCFKKGASYTTQEMIELHCVGNPFLLSQIQDHLCGLGAREADAGEFTRLAVKGGRLSINQAMAVMHLIISQSQDEHKRALNSLCHRQRDDVENIQNALHNAMIHIENELDFDDLDEGLLPESFFPELYQQLTKAWAVLRKPKGKDQQLKVLLWGKANAGKSTLFNIFGGQAITSNVAGTTRDWLSVTVEHEGLSFELIDTPGHDGPDASFDVTAKRLATEQKKVADLQLTIGRLVLAEVGVDWYSCSDEVPIQERPENSFSSLTGEGLDRLKKWIWQRLISTQPLHFFSEDHCLEIDKAFEELSSDVHEGLMTDAVIWSHHLRELARLFNPMGTKVHSDDVLNDLFSQFCIGK